MPRRKAGDIRAKSLFQNASVPFACSGDMVGEFNELAGDSGRSSRTSRSFRVVQNSGCETVPQRPHDLLSSHKNRVAGSLNRKVKRGLP
jgi:hypothetical protein